MWLLAWLSAASQAASCRILVDGVAASELDCEAPATWTLACEVPEANGKVRVRIAVAAHGLEAEAKVPLVDQQRFELALAAPRLRPGVFVATRATPQRPVGKPVGFTDVCPLIQPQGVKGQRTRLPLDVVVSVHQQTGFAEETLQGDVVRRVPTYDEGRTVLATSVPTWQRLVGEQPPAHVLAPPRNDSFAGRLQVADPSGTWRLLSWIGHRFDVPMPETGDAGTLRVLVLEFPAAEVAAVAGRDSVAWVEADLVRWLSGDLSAYLGLPAFARSELKPPVAAAWSARSRGGRSWRVATSERAEAQLAVAGDRLRVVLAWRGMPLEPAARAVIDGIADHEL